MKISFFDEYIEIIGTLFVVLLIFLFVHFKTKEVRDEGLITIAKVLRYEPAESGSDYCIEIYLDDKKYIARVNNDCQQDCIGNFFFVKVLKDHPASYPEFYGHNPVPSCIVDNVKVFKGWLKIPDCNNYLNTVVMH